MTNTFTQPLRDEHQELRPQIERLRLFADAVGELSLEAIRQDIDTASAFLTYQLIPHAQAEEQVLYPAIGRIARAPIMTETMSCDHREIIRLTTALVDLRAQVDGRSWSAEQESALRQFLYGLYTLITLHLAKEEEVYLPLLDRHLNAQKAQRLFAAMEAAARSAKEAAALSALAAVKGEAQASGSATN
jgi:iron-sulfur cluster repair protein YtfE (RIC family)